jgi:hypothetical protein
LPTCSYNLQFAEFDLDQVEGRGVASSADILAGFDTFAWAEQVDAANRLEKCSPTFSVFDVESDRLLWVSAVGEPDGFTFVNAYTFQGEVRGFLGLSRRRGPISAQTHELSLAEARRAIELFILGEHEALLQHLAL